MKRSANTEAVTQRCSVNKVFLEISQNSQENTCNFIKIEFLAQVLSFEFCEISKNTFFTEHLWTTASNDWRLKTTRQVLFVKYLVKKFQEISELSILRHFICRCVAP